MLDGSDESDSPFINSLDAKNYDSAIDLFLMVAILDRCYNESTYN